MQPGDGQQVGEAGIAERAAVGLGDAAGGAGQQGGGDGAGAARQHRADARGDAFRAAAAAARRRTGCAAASTTTGSERGAVGAECLRRRRRAADPRRRDRRAGPGASAGRARRSGRRWRIGVGVGRRAAGCAAAGPAAAPPSSAALLQRHPAPLAAAARPRGTVPSTTTARVGTSISGGAREVANCGGAEARGRRRMARRRRRAPWVAPASGECGQPGQQQQRR